MSARTIGLGGLLALTLATASFGPVIFSVLASTIRDTFGATRWQIGMLVAANLSAGALLSIWLGRAADRVSPWRAIVATLGTAAVSLLLLSLAPSYLWLAAAGAVGGLAQGASNPATNRLIMLHARRGARGVLTGVKQSGVQAGNALGGLILPVGAASLLGWRATVALAALLPLAGLALVAWLSDSAPPPATTEPRVTDSANSRPVRQLTLYSAIMGLATGALFTYLSLFAQEVFDWTNAGGGALVATFGGVGLVTRLTAGPLSERHIGHHRALGVMSGAAAGAAVLLAAATNGNVLWVAAILIGIGAMGWNVVANLAVMEVAAPGRAGHASGLMNGAFLAGMAAGPPLFGLVVDVLGTYRPAWFAVAGAALLASAVGLGLGAWEGTSLEAQDGAP